VAVTEAALAMEKATIPAPMIKVLEGKGMLQVPQERASSNALFQEAEWQRWSFHGERCQQRQEIQEGSQVNQ
jgi:hypothetical protein